jgi:hypothetical protein
MNKKLLDKLERALLKYERVIEQTDEHYDELDCEGRYGGYHSLPPYNYKHTIPFLISLLKKEGVNCEQFQEEYERITKKLEELEKRRGRDLREKLYSGLKEDVIFYPVMIGSFAEVEPHELEIPNDLTTRGSIEIYLMELERDYDLTEIKEEVAYLDEELKCKYMDNIEEILETYFDADDPYSPESFWWDHPSKLLEEKWAMKVKNENSGK